MAYEIVVERCEPRPLAAVRRRVRIGEVATSWQAPLDQVWAYLRAHPGLWTDGHNIFLYHHPAAREMSMDVDFGVQVTGHFQGDGEVGPVSTPPGTVVSTVHDGPIAAIRGAHDAIHTWSETSGRAIGDSSWEIYGDPREDGSFAVQVVYLLA